MLTIEFYLCGCFVGCTWLTHLSWASCVSFLLSPSVHTCICIQFHMISFKFSFSVIFPFYRHTFHRFNLNEGGLEMKLKALAWMMRSYTLHMHILVYLCVFVCKCRQMSTWRMAWGIRGQTVPSGPTAWNWPVSIKSTALSLSISLVLPSLPLSAHIHPRTDRQASAMCGLSGALMAFVRQPCWRQQARLSAPLWHARFVISPFSGGFGVILPPLREKWNQALWAFFPVRH